MPCSSTNTAVRTAAAASPSVVQSPVRTSVIASPASKPCTMARMGGGIGRAVCVAGSANTYTSSPVMSNWSPRKMAPAMLIDELPMRAQRSPTARLSSMRAEA